MGTLYQAGSTKALGLRSSNCLVQLRRTQDGPILRQRSPLAIRDYTLGLAPGNTCSYWLNYTAPTLPLRFGLSSSKRLPLMPSPCAAPFVHGSTQA